MYEFECHIYKAHMEKMLFIIKNELNTVILQCLREVFRLLIGEINDNIEKDNNNDFSFVAGEKRLKCLVFMREKNYGDLYTYLLTEFGKKLNIVALHKGLDITGREMLEFITMDDDPFKWYNNVRCFL